MGGEHQRGEVENPSCSEGSVKPSFPTGDAGKISKDDKERIAASIDAAHDEYLANQRVILGGDGEQKGLRFGLFKKQRRDWNRVRTCRFPECSQISIQGSHTIPEATLRLIAENGHLLTPSYNYSVSEMEAKSLGVNLASTFPGYCLEHEGFFQSFEVNVRMAIPLDFALQTYRTICREVYRLEHSIRSSNELVKNLKTRREKWFAKRIEQELGSRFKLASSDIVKGFKFNLVDRIRFLEEQTAEYVSDLAGFRGNFLSPFEEAFQSKNLSLPIIHLPLNKRLPLALAGRGNFHVQAGEKGDQITRIDVIINVSPTEAGTDICIAGPEDTGRHLKKYIGSFCNEAGQEKWVLSMIESWMLNGTDHWFMTPSAWGFLDETKRDLVLEAVANSDESIGFRPSVSILDSTRSQWE